MEFNLTKEQIAKIAELVTEINLNTSRGAFFNISGHCGLYDVSVCESKKRYQIKLFELNFRYYSDNNLDEYEVDNYIDEYEALISELEKFAREERIYMYHVTLTDGKHIDIHESFVDETEAKKYQDELNETYNKFYLEAKLEAREI